MEALENAIVAGLAGLGGAGIAILILLGVAKSAIFKAVEQAGERELRKLEHELEAQRQRSQQEFERALNQEAHNIQTEMARQREQFEREMERQRDAAATALEKFRTELVFRTEIRRRVAELKVEAVLRIELTGRTLILRLADTDTSTDQAWNLFREHDDAITRCFAFVDPVTRNKFISHLANCQGAIRNRSSERLAILGKELHDQIAEQLALDG